MEREKEIRDFSKRREIGPLVTHAVQEPRLEPFE
jgi:hypothetical protein